MYEVANEFRTIFDNTPPYLLFDDFMFGNRKSCASKSATKTPKTSSAVSLYVAVGGCMGLLSHFLNIAKRSVQGDKFAKLRIVHQLEDCQV